jgi:hypothetical protein
MAYEGHDIRSVQSEFTKDEILELYDDFIGGPAPEGQTKYELIHSIIDDIEANGVPVEDDCTDMMLDFLYVTGYVDEDGNLLPEPKEGDEESSDGVSEMTHGGVPDCYGFADDRDPACKKCTIFEGCMRERVDVRPECFAQLFDDTSEECSACLEYAACKNGYNN